MKPANRHSDRSMRSVSGACVVEESAIDTAIIPYRFLHCTHSTAPCVPVEMTEVGTNKQLIIDNEFLNIKHHTDVARHVSTLNIEQ